MAWCACEELDPVALLQLLLAGRNRRRRIDRPVAHAPAQEVIRRVVDGVLEVAVHEAVGDALGEGLGQPLDRAHFHDALDLAPLDEAQGHRGDQTEKSVAADGEAKELRVLGAAAVHHVAFGVHQAERFDIADEGRHAQAAAVHVRRQAAADRQLVGARLLLRKGPLVLASLLRRDEVLQDLRPLDSGLDLEVAFSRSKPSTRFMRRVSMRSPS